MNSTPPGQAGSVTSVARDSAHRFSKPPVGSIMLVAGHGVEGDAHYGRTVQHRSRKARTPNAPNLRQVHLLHSELLDEVANRGFRVAPGDFGENVLTRGIDLLSLPRGTVLALGPDARVRLTGLRNPCFQIDGLEQGLMKAVLDRDSAGNVVRKAGVMAVVLTGGVVRPGDGIRYELPVKPHSALQPV